ncbi:chloride channel protein [Ilumatobacter nonamiensis]|uniref:chloride channel protein n=1 Tax=Ilumatobacter nonamiensis TaxID=467093 RepID=UPI00058C0682|nr:chloride channel protein [Ilumatobacter nonamiensis]
MHEAARSRPASVVTLLVVAIATGALAGVIAAGFIWLVEAGTKYLWSDLPEQVGVEPYDSWWLFAVPIVGGALVGICQIALGNYPRPLEEAIGTWKRGGHIDPEVAPKTAVSSLVALSFGGPVGFEAALTGLLGGTATWIGQRITTVGHLVRNAWGAETVDGVPRAVHALPYWLAALAGLFTYHWLPFGVIDFGFRFTEFDGDLGVAAGLAGFAFGALVVVPVAWAVSVVSRAEHATTFRRNPILVGMAGGLLFALLALPNQLVLFSGQEGIQLLPSADLGDLAYITVAKWAALVIALLAGWRGGPIFPTYTSVAALAVIVDEVVDVGPDIMIVAGIAATGVVFLKGNLPMAFILTLYPVQASYASVILIGCAGGAVGLAVARSLGALPTPPAEPAPTPS